VDTLEKENKMMTRKYGRATLAGLIGCFFLVFGAVAGEVEISVNHSTVINPPDSLAGEYGPRFLLSFDLPDVLNGEEITYAEVVSTANLPSVNRDEPVIFEAYPLTCGWVQGASWSSPWTNQGGDYDLDRREIFTLKTGGQGSLLIEVTRIVDRWVQGRATNYGLILIPVKMNGAGYAEFSDPEGTFRSNARLKIYY
jgi:hypothetical protein